MKSFLLILIVGLNIQLQAQQNLPADINHIIGYGQSLSLGSTDRMSINSTGLRYSNTLMFNNGLRLRKGEVDESMRSFVPLVEHEKEETPSSGFADMFLQTMLKDNAAYNASQSLLFRTPGWGGKSIKVLRRNAIEPDYYESLLRGVRRGMVIATAMNKTFNVPCFTWTQGEEDLFRGMTTQEYKEELACLYNELNSDVKSLTGQTNDVKCIMYQTASHNRYYLITNRENKEKNPAVAIAQYQMAIEGDNIYMATPMYPFDYNLDNVHLRAEYSRLLGAYYGYVAKKVLIDKQDWKPVHPIHYEVEGNRIKIKFYVPVPPLVIDTQWVQFIDNYGFNIYRDNTEVIIKKVSIVSDEEIEFICNEDIQDGDRLTYAINGINTGRFIGSRGNIRDSQGDKVTYNIGCTTYHLHNWLPIYEEYLATNKK